MKMSLTVVRFNGNCAIREKCCFALFLVQLSYYILRFFVVHLCKTPDGTFSISLIEVWSLVWTRTKQRYALQMLVDSLFPATLTVPLRRFTLAFQGLALGS